MTPEAQRIAIAEACGWTEIKMLNDLNMFGGYNQTGGIKTSRNHPVGLAPDMNTEHPSLLSCDGVTRFRPDQSWWASVPDYLNDLNAMHAACLERGQIELHNFAMKLRKIIVRDCDDKRLDDRISDFWFYNATAAQRAEAFLRTLNLWKD